MTWNSDGGLVGSCIDGDNDGDNNGDDDNDVVGDVVVACDVDGNDLK